MIVSKMLHAVLLPRFLTLVPVQFYHDHGPSPSSISRDGNHKNFGFLLIIVNFQKNIYIIVVNIVILLQPRR